MTREEAEQKRAEKLAAERERTERLFSYEKQYGPLGVVCGIDEAGRGPLAGPVVAAAVILERDDPILYLNDSKKLSPKKREALYGEIVRRARSFGIGTVSPERIDEINILQATYEAMREAVSRLTPCPNVLLNDAVRIPGLAMHQVPIIGGDGKSASIAAASILAKVTRDRIMLEYDRRFPQYGFAAHKGYGTKRHREALEKYGVSPIHRLSFVRTFLRAEP